MLVAWGLRLAAVHSPVNRLQLEACSRSPRPANRLQPFLPAHFPTVLISIPAVTRSFSSIPLRIESSGKRASGMW
jgi:hypothetical protein